jgi:ketosteroid isomerase-like protein
MKPKSETMMRLILLVITVTISAASLVSGQSVKQNDALEQEIRKLDLAEADAILRGDIAALKKLLAEDFTVNNPRNEIAKGREEVFALIRNGTINYSSFVREPEIVLFHGNTVVVMGLETIKLTSNAPGAGQTIRRRYTNIWMKKKGKWLLTARHASVICQN